MNYKGIDRKEQLLITKQKTIRTINFFKALGMNGGGFHFATKIALYKSFIRSSIEYGLAILQYQKNDMQKIESLQHLALCEMFSVSINTSMDTLQLLTGLSSLKIREEILKAKFLLRFSDQCENMSLLLPRVVKWMKCLKLDSVIEKLKAKNILKISAENSTNTNFKKDNIFKQHQKNYLKELITRVKIFTETPLKLSDAESINKTIKNWRIDKKAIRNISLYLLNKFPGKPQKCKKCAGMACKKHIIICNSNLWTDLIFKIKLLKLSPIAKAIIENGVIDEIGNIPFYLIKTITIREEKSEIKNAIAVQLSETIIKCLKECMPVKDPT